MSSLAICYYCRCTNCICYSSRPSSSRTPATASFPDDDTLLEVARMLEAGLLGPLASHPPSTAASHLTTGDVRSDRLRSIESTIRNLDRMDQLRLLRVCGWMPVEGRSQATAEGRTTTASATKYNDYTGDSSSGTSNFDFQQNVATKAKYVPSRTVNFTTSQLPDTSSKYSIANVAKSFDYRRNSVTKPSIYTTIAKVNPTQTSTTNTFPYFSGATPSTSASARKMTGEMVPEDVTYSTTAPVSSNVILLGDYLITPLDAKADMYKPRQPNMLFSNSATTSNSSESLDFKRSAVLDPVNHKVWNADTQIGLQKEGEGNFYSDCFNKTKLFTTAEVRRTPTIGHTSQTEPGIVAQDSTVRPFSGEYQLNQNTAGPLDNDWLLTNNNDLQFNGSSNLYRPNPHSMSREKKVSFELKQQNGRAINTHPVSRNRSFGSATSSFSDSAVEEYPYFDRNYADSARRVTSSALNDLNKPESQAKNLTAAATKCNVPLLQPSETAQETRQMKINQENVYQLPKSHFKKGLTAVKSTHPLTDYLLTKYSNRNVTKSKFKPEMYRSFMVDGERTPDSNVMNMRGIPRSESLKQTEYVDKPSMPQYVTSNSESFNKHNPSNKSENLELASKELTDDIHEVFHTYGANSLSTEMFEEILTEFDSAQPVKVGTCGGGKRWHEDPIDHRKYFGKGAHYCNGWYAPKKGERSDTLESDANLPIRQAMNGYRNPAGHFSFNFNVHRQLMDVIADVRRMKTTDPQGPTEELEKDEAGGITVCREEETTQHTVKYLEAAESMVPLSETYSQTVKKISEECRDLLVALNKAKDNLSISKSMKPRLKNNIFYESAFAVLCLDEDLKPTATQDDYEVASSSSETSTLKSNSTLLSSTNSEKSTIAYRPTGIVLPHTGAINKIPGPRGGLSDGWTPSWLASKRLHKQSSAKLKRMSGSAEQRQKATSNGEQLEDPDAESYKRNIPTCSNSATTSKDADKGQCSQNATKGQTSLHKLPNKQKTSSKPPSLVPAKASNRPRTPFNSWKREGAFRHKKYSIGGKIVKVPVHFNNKKKTKLANRLFMNDKKPQTSNNTEKKGSSKKPPKKSKDKK